MPMIINLSLTLPEEAAHLPMLRRVTRETLGFYHISPQEIDDIELIVGELATNAARHSGAEHYRVEIELSEAQVLVTVSDKGVGFDRGAVQEPGTERPDFFGTERIGGLGLPLVEMLADSVEFSQGVPAGTVVRTLKILHKV